VHHLAPEAVEIHVVHKVNKKAMDLDKYKELHLSNVSDPLVVHAPFNAFATAVQVWLSRNDHNYAPIYIFNQENLGECDLIPRRSADEMDLDENLVPNIEFEIPPPNFLEQDTVMVDAPWPLDPVTGAISQEETDQAVLNIPPPPQQHVNYPIPAADAQSDVSSDLEDYSHVVQASPAHASILYLDDEAQVQPNLLNLVDALNEALPEIPPPEELPQVEQLVQPGIDINLNINPHHNMFSPLVLPSESDSDSADTSVESVESIGSSLPSLDNVNETISDFPEIPDFFGIFEEPMRDLTNIPDTWQE
jgi:hypothetical protein